MIEKIMQELYNYCKENKIDVDLEAKFKGKKEQMNYLWRF